MNWVQINRKRGNKMKFRAWGFQISLLFFLSCGSVYAQSQICITGTVTSGGDSNETYYCYSGFGSMDELWEFLGRNDPELGGGGHGTPVNNSVVNMPDNRFNPNPANCNSDRETRTLHAGSDFSAYRIRFWGFQMEGTGREVMRITYDDGSWELYSWVGPVTITMVESFLFPIPGTFSGCIRPI